MKELLLRFSIFYIFKMDVLREIIKENKMHPKYQKFIKSWTILLKKGSIV